MNDDERARFKTIINYWIEHNKEHSQEFEEWADKAREMGENEACKAILQAARDMDEATESLFQALSRIETRE